MGKTRSMAMVAERLREPRSQEALQRYLEEEIAAMMLTIDKRLKPDSPAYQKRMCEWITGNAARFQTRYEKMNGDTTRVCS